MSSIFISFNPKGFAERGLAQLKKAGHRITMYRKAYGISRKELLAGVRGKDAILTLLTDHVDEEVLRAAGPQLKIVANYAVGFDNVDLAAAKKHNIIVTNTPAEEVSESVAEHTTALIFALTHRIVEADHATRHGRYKGWEPNLLLGYNLVGKTLGVIGTGRIGTNVIHRLVDGFGLKVLYTDVKPNAELKGMKNVTYTTLETVLRESDIITLHVPLLPSTKHLINAKNLRLMKPGAFLVNTARGPIIDAHALVAALKSKKIAGAGLDVFECEPAFACDPKDAKYLQNAWNVILTPHLGSATFEAREAMGEVAAQNILAVLSGKKPLNPAA